MANHAFRETSMSGSRSEPEVDSKRARGSWNHPEQVLEAMVSFSRLETDTGPLQIYLTLSELDSERSAQREVVPRDDASDGARLCAVQQLVSSLFRISGIERRFDHPVYQCRQRRLIEFPTSNCAETPWESFRRISGLWQILARQGEIPKGATRFVLAESHRSF